MALSWGQGPWVADTSAWARASHSSVSRQWKAAARRGEIVACPVVTMELLFDALDHRHVEEVADAVSALRQAPITSSVTDTAISAIRELAARGSAGSHRVRVPDAMVAAAAAERGFAVLHYDHHFDRLASVLGFRSQWVAQAGSIP